MTSSVRRTSKERRNVDLTFIIPCHKQSILLKDSLDSLASQQDIALEVLVIEETDEQNSEDIIAQYKKQELAITLLRHSEQHDRLSACVRGMDKAIGRWLSFMEAGGVLTSPETCSKCVAEADACSSDIVHFQSVKGENGPKGRLRHADVPFSTRPLKGREIFHHWLSTWQSQHPIWGKLYGSVRNISHFPHTVAGIGRFAIGLYAPFPSLAISAVENAFSFAVGARRCIPPEPPVARS